jgi:putative inorganic carbon (hco3(-)) transporter
MSSKGLLFFGLFWVFTLGALFLPYLGVYGYIADYCIGPAGQWWEAPFSGLGIRYSFTLALATAVSMVIHWKKLEFGEPFLSSQEKLLLFFLALVWLSTLLSEETTGRYTFVDHPSLKFSKVVFFALMMTHVITNMKKMDGLLWIFVISSLILGLQAWDTPRSDFHHGRLEGIGGADFSESNFLAAFMAAMLPIIGVQLLRAKWWGKAICVIAAAFTANTIVLCRSRGAFVGVAAGVVAASVLAPKRHRKKIAVALVLGIAGGVYVADPQFLERITTITTSQEEMDTSAMSRIRLWKAGAEMLSDHPFGIGIGNWYQTIGSYIPEYAGKDSHSTYVKCAVELGIQGIIFYFIIILSAVIQLFRMRKTAENLHEPFRDDMTQFSYGLIISLVIILVCGLTITMIYTEVIWLIIILPVCLVRIMNNIYSENSDVYPPKS